MGATPNSTLPVLPGEQFLAIALYFDVSLGRGLNHRSKSVDTTRSQDTLRCPEYYLSRFQSGYDHAIDKGVRLIGCKALQYIPRQNPRDDEERLYDS